MQLLFSGSPDQTIQFGIRLGQLLASGDTICLSGDLGAGKTAFTRGIGKGWGALETVNSPTFVFVHEHHRQGDDLRLYHIDCYRLESLDDAATIGLEDLLAGDNIAVIEWPERIEAILPVERLWITLNPDGDTTRQLALEPMGARYETLLHDYLNLLQQVS
jgi:tRNA threonylcarbamoyladenosine biosynthesis protein TsaE